MNIDIKIILKKYDINANEEIIDDPNKEFKLDELNYNDRFKLSLLLTVREPWIMKSYYKYDAIPYIDLKGKGIKSFFQLYNGENQTRQIFLIDKPDIQYSEELKDLIPKIKSLVNEINIQVIIALNSDSVSNYCRTMYRNNTFSYHE